MAINLSWPRSSSAWVGFVNQTGLQPDVAYRALLLAWYATDLRLQIQLSSAYRSPEYQLQLQRRWDAGDRAGLTTRPATSSKHTEGRAFDVGIVGPAPTKAAWESLGRLGEALGLRWGGRFEDPDPVHFDY